MNRRFALLLVLVCVAWPLAACHIKNPQVMPEAIDDTAEYDDGAVNPYPNAKPTPPDSPAAKPALLENPMPIGADDPRQALKRLVRDVDVGRPLTRHGVSIFPVFTGDPAAELATSAAGGLQFVAGLKGRRYLRVQNPTGRPVLLLAGEILSGSRERIVAADTLIAPGASARVPALYTIRRAAPAATSLSPANALAPRPLRRVLFSYPRSAASDLQRRIDQRVDNLLARYGAVGQPDDLTSLYRRDYARRLAQCLNRTERPTPPRTVGLIVMVDGRLLGLEIFPHATARRAWATPALLSMLLGQPVAEDLCRPSRADSTSQAEAQRALRSLADADLFQRPDANATYQLRDNGSTWRGTMTLFRGDAAHLVMLGKKLRRFDVNAPNPRHPAAIVPRSPRRPARHDRDTHPPTNSTDNHRETAEPRPTEAVPPANIERRETPAPRKPDRITKKKDDEDDDD
jgi:ARG and Rhodanese-Phosphatase-superfamily-associated Protein domain